MKKPNLLFIMSDDHASNAISAYDSRFAKVFQTPNLDRLAKEGCKVTSCCCTNAICTPSRASILTGKYPHTTGVKTLSDCLPSSETTYPELFQENGYNTALFGKWHVHCKPKGFDDYKVLPGQGKYFNPTFVDETSEGWNQLDHTSQPDLDYPEGEVYEGYVTKVITDMCLNWLDHRDQEKPFMLMCHHKAPHDYFEYDPQDEHLLDGVDIPEPDSLWEDKSHRSEGSRDFGTTVSDGNMRRSAVRWMSAPNYISGQLDTRGMTSKERTSAAYQKYLKDYLRTVKGMDDHIGRLLDYLDENGLRENTIVIYTSDQGMYLGEHDYIDKRWMFDEALKMPFLIRYPEEIQPSSEMDSIFSNVDFAPTLLDYAGIEVPSDMQGSSVRDLLKGGSDDKWPNVVYNRYWMHMAHHDTPAHYGMRTKDYKLIYFYGLPLDATGAIDYVTPEGWELYDLKKDPEERRNVYDDPAYQEVICQLKTQLRTIKKQIGDQDSKFPEMLSLNQSLY